MSRPQTPLDIARQHVEHALGPKVAKRLDTFDDMSFYVMPGPWKRLFAWLVDVLFYLVLAGVGFVVFAAVTRNSEVSDNVAALTMIGLLIGTPILYGLFFGNGRGIGAVLTGTRLVRVKNGSRIGASGAWAMLVRTILFPVLTAALIFDGSTSVGSLRRVSIDDDATRRLHAAGFLRFNVPSSV